MENQKVYQLEQGQRSLSDKVDNIERMMIKNVESTAIMDYKLQQINNRLVEINSTLESMVGDK